MLGAVSAEENTAHDDAFPDNNLSSTRISESLSEDDFYINIPENDTSSFSKDISNESLKTLTAESDFSKLNLPANKEKDSYDNQYYLFRGDCWTINNNFESTAAITSKSYTDLTVTGTFRTQNDMVGIYWNSKDIIQHPYISYGVRNDYSNVKLEFDYEMSGCIDFSNPFISISIATNNGETYYLTMNRFIKNNHVSIDFNKLTLSTGNFYLDRNNGHVTIKKQTKLDVKDIKSIMFVLIPENYVESPNYTIMKNVDFKCTISNISVVNGAIRNELPALEPHQYRLCEGYDDIYNLNPLRITHEMRKLGYVGWVNLFIGASHYYEKYGEVGDVIVDMNFNNNRTEKMHLDKNVPLNIAFKEWLDCYSRELKKNDVDNIVISVSLENLQSPHEWRQMDCNGNFAVTGWNPSTFLNSPCNDEAVQYMQNVSGACLDIVAANGFQPILQMGEVWWWWNENSLPNQSPCFYDNSTKAKYLAEYGTNLPEYENVWTTEYDNATMNWLNQQLVKYSDSISKVVKSDRYDDGLYIALFFLPSVLDSDRVPSMIKDINYLPNAYSPSKLDILQIEDYDWIIYESIHHKEAYAIGKELGFNESSLHYFGGFVLYPEDAAKYWPLIEKALEDAIEHKFKEVYVWAGTQVRRDNKILGYDEYAIIHNLLLTNTPGVVSPVITVPEYVSTGENFSIEIRTNKWINGNFNIYEYDYAKKGKLLASSKIVNGYSSAKLSSDNVSMNKFYLEFDYINGGYHLIQNVNIIENSPSITVNLSTEIETGSKGNISFNAPESSNGTIYFLIDGNLPYSFMVEHGKFKGTVSGLSRGYHTILVRYNDGKYINGKLVGNVYYKTFTVKVGTRTILETADVAVEYGTKTNLTLNLKDRNGNPLKGKDIKITLNGIIYNVTTDKMGRASLPIDLMPGNYAARLIYAGDDTYLSSSATASISIKKIATSLTSKDINLIYGDSAYLIATLKDSKNNAIHGKNIKVTLNGKTHTLTTDRQGQAKLPIDILPGKYSAKIEFREDEIYLSSSFTANVIVNKISTNLAINNISNTLIITLKDEKKNALKGKGIAVSLNGKVYDVTTDSKGQATLEMNLLPGTYTATASFDGDQAYISSSAKIQVTIIKIATSMTSHNLNFTYGDPTSLKVIIKDIKNNPLKGKDILITLDSKEYKVISDKNGQATLAIRLLPGKYTAKMKFMEDNIYKASSTAADIVIEKVTSILTAKDIMYTYGSATDLLVSLKDTKGNVLKEKSITITLNGMDYSVTTDINGQTRLPIDLMPGKYSAKIQFKGDGIYTPSSAAAEIIVNKIATELTAKDINIAYGDSANLIITLKDSKNNVMKGKSISISMNGRNHTLTSDNNGQATLPIDLLPGKYTATIQFKQDNTYLASTTNANIAINKLETVLIAKDINIIYGNLANLIITLKDNKSNALKGKSISISLNNMDYTVTSDNNGQATLPIELLPGKYTATIQFRQDNIYLASTTNANIAINKVATVLTAKNINIAYGNSANIVATLKDSQGKALAGKVISIKLNNKVYNKKTNANGHAILNVNLAAQRYNAKIGFAGDDAYKASVHTSKVIVNKATPKITASYKTFKANSRVKKVTVTLKNKNKFVKNALVKLTINKKTYKVSTNSKGVAIFFIKLTKKGKYIAVYKYDGNSNFKSTTKKVRITIY